MIFTEKEDGTETISQQKKVDCSRMRQRDEFDCHAEIDTSKHADFEQKRKDGP